MSGRCSREVSRDSEMNAYAATMARDPDGDVDVEDPVPADPLGDDPRRGSGPIASARAETPAQIPIAVPRWRGGKVTVMIESVAGFMSAAPRPWTTRAAISIVAVAGEPTGERRAREHDEPDHEDAAAGRRGRRASHR